MIGSIIWSMVIDMNESRLASIEQLRVFLDGTVGKAGAQKTPQWVSELIQTMWLTTGVVILVVVTQCDVFVTNELHVDRTRKEGACGAGNLARMAGANPIRTMLPWSAVTGPSRNSKGGCCASWLTSPLNRFAW